MAAAVLVDILEYIETLLSAICIMREQISVYCSAS